MQHSLLRFGPAYPLYHYVSYSNFSTAHTCSLSAITHHNEPASYKQAVQVEHWKQAMRKELEALKQNYTWILEQLHVDKRAIVCKWVYKIKFKSDESFEIYKERLVSK